MSNLLSFDFNNNQVRVITINDEPWFLGADVCRVLEIQNTGNVYSRLKEYEKTIRSVDGVDNPNTVCVSESGLYRLIMTSRKPQAESFQDWVVQEVLPSIRKTGSYSVQSLTPGQLLKLQAEAIIAIEEKQEQQAKDIKEIQGYINDADNLARMYIAKGDITPPAELTLATKINLIVRSYCNQTNSDHKLVWRDLYREFKLREKVDVRTRHINAINRGDVPKSMNKLTYLIDKLNMGNKFYSVVVHCCIRQQWTDVVDITSAVIA